MNKIIFIVIILTICVLYNIFSTSKESFLSQEYKREKDVYSAAYRTQYNPIFDINYRQNGYYTHQLPNPLYWTKDMNNQVNDSSIVYDPLTGNIYVRPDLIWHPLPNLIE